MNTIRLPEDVKLILTLLRERGFEAYAVGGCVRDSLLGRVPGDWDITTDALPEEMKQIFHRTIDTGIQHGTVTVRIHGKGYEVTTYRIDGEYKDARHPEKVTYTASLEEDLRRRDFTVNAMAYSDETGLRDFHHGLDDLQRGIIRAVGDPESRFTEDALRILRCYRFASQLGFTIDPATERAAEKLSPSLSMISAERIHAELLKTLTSDHPGKLRPLLASGAFSPFYPELPSHLPESFRIMEAVGKTKTERLAAFFTDTAFSGEENGAVADRVLRSLKSDNETRLSVIRFLRFRDADLSADRETLRRFLHAFGTGLLTEYFRYVSAVRDRDLSESEAIANDILEKKECVAVGMLSVNGNDLAELGIRGKKTGEILNALLEIVLHDPSENDRDTLLKEARKLISQNGGT